VIVAQHVVVSPVSLARIDAFTSHRDFGNSMQYFFRGNTVNLHQGRISVTCTACVGGSRGDSGPLVYELNRRQTCPRASKLSLHSASSSLSQHAHSKKKKLLLLSQWSKSPHSASSNTFAGRAIQAAPQNHTFSSAHRVEQIPLSRKSNFSARASASQGVS